MWLLRPSTLWSSFLIVVRDGWVHATFPSGLLPSHSISLASSGLSILHIQAQSLAIDLSWQTQVITQARAEKCFTLSDSESTLRHHPFEESIAFAPLLRR